MSSRRIYGCDYGKGLAIVGMLLAHTFEAGVCDWNHDVEMNYINRIPLWLLICISPIALVCLMGLFFTFITSITCTFSIVRIEKKGKKAVMAYFLYRFMFGMVLKVVELVVTQWWSNYGIFDKLVIDFPKTAISVTGGTLDSIAWCGLLVPMAVYYVRRIPTVKDSWISQVSILSIIAVVLLMCYNYIADYSLLAAEWCHVYQFNFLYMLLSKVGSGPFMISQCLPFGLIGGCIGLIMLNSKKWKHLWRFAWCIVGISVGTALFFLFTQDNPLDAVMDQRKPCFLRFLELSFEVVVIVAASYFSDCEQRSLISRYNFNKQVTFLRRISVVSLSCFIFEKWVSNQLRKVFNVLAGPPYDVNTNESLWSFWVVVLFMVTNFVIDLYIIRLWESVQFRFSCEHMISAILSFLFNRKEEVDWKASNHKIIYGPVEELEKAILESADADKLKKSKGGEEGPGRDLEAVLRSEVELIANNPEHSEGGDGFSATRRQRVGERQEMELTTTLVGIRAE